MAIEAALMIMREADKGFTSGVNTFGSGATYKHRYGRPAVRQASCNWNAHDKYVELLYFEMEVKNILQMKAYKLSEEEKLPTMKNLPGREGLQLIQKFTNSEKEACKTVQGIFFLLGKKFKLHHNKNILPLQYCKLKKSGICPGMDGQTVN